MSKSSRPTNGLSSLLYFIFYGELNKKTNRIYQERCSYDDLNVIKTSLRFDVAEITPTL